LQDAASAVKTLESELDTCKEQNTKVNKDLTKATKRGDRLDKRVNELRVANEELTDANAELQRLNKVRLTLGHHLGPSLDAHGGGEMLWLGLRAAHPAL
jgi:predicted  nucleic acid-binding Zn-ribbon protein